MVILTKKDYAHELNRLVNDTTTYQLLKKNPNKELKSKLKIFLNKGIADHIINKKDGRYMLPKAPRIPVIYQVPKIHKNKSKPPGRPIISGINSVHSRLGEYLDEFLQPLAAGGNSFIKDSKDVINTLTKVSVKDSTLLVTIDVESLYTNIKQVDALAAVAWALKNHSKLKLKQRRFILEGLRMAMKNNFFWHDHRYYSQIKGVGMGNKYAPSVANIFLNKWESEEIFGKSWPQIQAYKRFIDDILIVWEGSHEQLKGFIEHINHNNYGIKFTTNIQTEVTQFLDLEIFKNGKELHTRTHFKETDRNGYIPYGSCHHPQWKRAIPKGQFIRIKRNCNSSDDYQRQTNILIDRFVEKGYERNRLEKTRSEVNSMNRNEMLKDKERKPPETNDVTFVTGFSADYRAVEKIITKHWPIIRGDADLNKILPAKPKFIYRRARRIRDTLVKNVPDPPKKMTTFFDQKGFYRCGKCKPCRITKGPRKVSHFTSHANKKEFKIDKLITCSSTHVTYVLECECGIQYVGRTTRKLSVRMGEHIRNIKKGFIHHSVSLHFRQKHNRDPSKLKIYAIDKIEQNWRNLNMRREISRNETEWIFKMDTLKPKGMNVELDVNCFLEDY